MKYLKLLPFIILILIWVLPVSIYIRIPITLLIGIDIQRTYFPSKERKDDDNEENNK
jgi:hypothetical protein